MIPAIKFIIRWIIKLPIYTLGVFTSLTLGTCLMVMAFFIDLGFWAFDKGIPWEMSINYSETIWVPTMLYYYCKSRIDEREVTVATGCFKSKEIVNDEKTRSISD